MELKQINVGLAAVMVALMLAILGCADSGNGARSSANDAPAPALDRDVGTLDADAWRARLAALAEVPMIPGHQRELAGALAAHGELKTALSIVDGEGFDDPDFRVAGVRTIVIELAGQGRIEQALRIAAQRLDAADAADAVSMGVDSWLRRSPPLAPPTQEQLDALPWDDPHTADVLHRVLAAFHARRGEPERANDHLQRIAMEATRRRAEGEVQRYLVDNPPPTVLFDSPRTLMDAAVLHTVEMLMQMWMGPGGEPATEAVAAIGRGDEQAYAAVRDRLLSEAGPLEGRHGEAGMLAVLGRLLVMADRTDEAGAWLERMLAVNDTWIGPAEAPMPRGAMECYLFCRVAPLERVEAAVVALADEGGGGLRAVLAAATVRDVVPALVERGAAHLVELLWEGAAGPAERMQIARAVIEALPVSP